MDIASLLRRILLKDMAPTLEWALGVLAGRDVMLNAYIPFIVWLALVVAAAASIPYHLWRWQHPAYKTARNVRVFILSACWIVACLGVVLRSNPQVGLFIIPAGIGVWMYTSARAVAQGRKVASEPVKAVADTPRRTDG